MIARTEAEITEFCEALWGGGDGFKAEWANNCLSVSQMFDSPDLTLTHLMALARFFGTMNVGKFDDIDMGGCESCDYGSSRGFVLRVADGPEPPA